MLAQRTNIACLTRISLAVRGQRCRLEFHTRTPLPLVTFYFLQSPSRLLFGIIQQSLQNYCRIVPWILSVAIVKSIYDIPLKYAKSHRLCRHQPADFILRRHESLADDFEDCRMGGPNIGRELGLAKLTGGFDIADVESVLDPSTIVVVMVEKTRPQYARATMVVDVSKDIYPVTKFDIGPIITPIKFIRKDDPRRPRYEKALQSLTADTRRAVINATAEVLRDQYIILDTIEAMISALESHYKNGDYNNITESEKFAARLTKDLHSSC